ncbi:MAG: methyltransferase domain-containing protein [Gammaproteobacteria bacterium]|nr:methyltransferase domain-containing protein [Gammaproteobacteria bacterium]MCP5201770.1 methyltransferase domain-containing protein [Gammaproteobacteria bacterium]
MPAPRNWRQHRDELRALYDVDTEFEALEESCIPSYLHGNALAARFAWQRLAAAVDHYSRLAPAGPVLDFGAGSGVLARLLPAATPYHYVEQDDALAARIAALVTGGRREHTASLPPTHFAAVFALDSLEHNEDVSALLAALAATLRPDGVLILSGPTENLLYRLGRWVAGFSGHYHHQTIYDIEAVAAGGFRRVRLASLPLRFAPLFRVTAWRCA